MAVPLSDSPEWEEIELSESYLVCAMFEEASSLASSILKRLCKTGSTELIEVIQLEDMMESAGMVLVQSLKELGRTPEIMNELKALFCTAAAIPVQVLITGACFQISEGCSSGLQAIFEEFLDKWEYADEQSYVLKNLGQENTASEGCIRHSVLAMEKYMDVVEIYAVSLLGRVLGDIDLAISWMEKAELPEEKRQEMLRRLHSLCSLKDLNSLLGLASPQSLEKSKSNIISRTDSTTSEGSRSVETEWQPNGFDTKSAICKSKYQTLSHLSLKMAPCFCWFRTVSLKFGNVSLTLSHGRTLLWSSLIIFICYILRRKGNMLKWIASRQGAAMKKALIDAWQLAFSVQVNPLAAVQPLPHAAHGSR